MSRSMYKLFGILSIINVVLIVSPITLAPIPPFGAKDIMVPFYEQWGGRMRAGNFVATWQLLTNLYLLTFFAALVRKIEADRGKGEWSWMWFWGASLGFISIATVAALFFDMSPFLYHLGDSFLQAMVQLALICIQLADAFQTMLMMGIGWAIMRYRFLPKGFGYAAWFAAAMSVTGTWGLLKPFDETVFARHGAVTLFVGGPIHQLWLLILGVYWLFAKEPVKMPVKSA